MIPVTMQSSMTGHFTSLQVRSAGLDGSRDTASF